MIETKCPYCQIESEADDVQLNRAVRCPGCRKVFILHAHSTEVSLDPIIPGVPRPKPEEEPPQTVSPHEALPHEGKPVTTKIDSAFRHTLKLRTARKPPVTGPRSGSPLLDAEPTLHPVEKERKEGERAGMNLSFLSIFRTTGLVLLSILIYSLLGGALIALVLLLTGKLFSGH